MYSFLFNGIDCTAPSTSAYIFEVVELAAYVTPVAICWASSQFMFLSAIFTFSSSAQCICCWSFVSVLDIFLYHYVKDFALCKLLITIIWTLWTYTLFAQVSIFSVHMVIFSSHFVSSLMISASISSLFKPCVNCSFSYLSLSL